MRFRGKEVLVLEKHLTDVDSELFEGSEELRKAKLEELRFSDTSKAGLGGRTESGATSSPHEALTR